ncbi:MAG: beta-lactamase family protein [Spirochaetales bacterium]|nr:beta-lactamase family protein [Spirochaetales bacterium]
MKQLLLLFIVMSILLPCFGESLEKKDIAVFFENRIPDIMKEHTLAGLGIAIIHRGEVVYQAGFGYSDVDAKIPVDPETTLFRLGSISKLFTWTAVMQLVEAGKIDLDENIATYLGDIEFTDKNALPITMKNLMSHTPGLEDYLIGLFIKDPSKIKTLETIIRGKKLKQIWPPGTQIAYSNFGTMLAGLIVEKVSNMGFEEYTEKNIFTPLNMKYSTFRQPLPQKLQPFMSKGYVRIKDEFQAEDFEIVQGAPAGGVSMSITDMARFGLSHLKHGPRLMSDETLDFMHTSHYKQDPRMNGFAHGFIEANTHGQRIIAHGGDTIYFHSLAGLFPESDFGFVVSTNTATGMQANFALFNAFMDHFFSTPTGEERGYSTKSVRELNRFAGSYICNRRSESDMTKLMSLGMTLEVKVSRQPDSLDILNFLDQKVYRYVEVEKNIFQRFGGTDKYVFFENSDQVVTSLMLNDFPVFMFHKRPFIENPFLFIFLLVIMVLIILSGIVIRPTGIMAMVSKKHITKGLEKIAGLAGFALLISYVVFFISLITGMSGDIVFSDLPVFPFVIIGCTFVINCALVPFCVLGWIKNFWTLFGRIFYTGMTLISSLLLVLFYYWKLLFPG